MYRYISHYRSSIQHPTLLTANNGDLYEQLATDLLVKKRPALSETLSHDVIMSNSH